MNLQKFNRNQSHNILIHCNRSDPNRTYKNQEINHDLTYLNYNLAPTRNITDYEFMKQRSQELKALKRKDVNTLCSWVVTLPKNFTGNQQDFFKKSYDFLENRYGKENVVSAYVHLDETSPHLHFTFVPAYYNKNKEKWTCNAKKLIDKVELKQIHSDMQKYLEKELNIKVDILNGSTTTNKTIEQLKADEKVKKEAIKELEKKLEPKVEFELRDKLYNESIKMFEEAKDEAIKEELEKEETKEKINIEVQKKIENEYQKTAQKYDYDNTLKYYKKYETWYKEEHNYNAELENKVNLLKKILKFVINLLPDNFVKSKLSNLFNLDEVEEVNDISNIEKEIVECSQEDEEINNINV